MSLIGGLIIKSGRPTLPQWGMRPLVTDTRTLDLTMRNTWFTVFGPAGDVNVLYFNNASVLHNETIEVRCLVDGTTFTAAGQGHAGPPHQYYYYLDPSSDALLHGADGVVTQAGLDYPWYGQSFEIQIRKTTNNSNVGQFVTETRYQQL